MKGPSYIIIGDFDLIFKFAKRNSSCIAIMSCTSGCLPGYAGTATCTQCSINTYSPGHLDECISCLELSETDGPGATSVTNCSK